MEIVLVFLCVFDDWDNVDLLAENICRTLLNDLCAKKPI
jgi:hypothetical protein